MSGDESLRLVAHGVSVQLALGLGCYWGAVRQGEAVQGCLGMTLEKSCAQIIPQILFIAGKKSKSFSNQ